MARRKRRSFFGSLVSFPQVGALKDYNPLGKTVNSTDVLLGAAVGMAGGAVVKMGINKLNEAIGGKLPAFVLNYIGPISTFGAGALAYMVRRKSKPAQASGLLVGATMAAVVPLGWQILRDSFPQYFSGLVNVDYGMLTTEADSYSGLLVDDPSMNGLAAYSMADDVDVLDAA